MISIGTKMQQMNGVTVIGSSSQEQSDLVTSATITAAVGQQKEPIKNGKSVIVNGNGSAMANNINKSKITTLINSANNSKSSNSTTNINNNNNSSTTNKNNSTKPRSDVIVTSLQQQQQQQQQSNKSATAATISAQQQPASTASSVAASTTATAATTTTSTTNGTAKTAAPLPDARAKQVLKEAVDAVVNSFTKHTQGYGRGEC